MGLLFEAAIVAIIAVVIVAPALFYKNVVGSAWVPQFAKDAGVYVMDNFISTALLLLIISVSLFMYGKDKNKVKLGMGLVAAALIVAYQMDKLRFVPGADAAKQSTATAQNSITSAMTLSSWQLYAVSALFIALSLYLIRKIFMRRVLLGGFLLGGGEFDDDDDEMMSGGDDDEEIDFDEMMSGGLDEPILDDGLEDDIVGGLDEMSEEEEQAYMSTMGGANHAFNEYIRDIGDSVANDD